MKAEIVPAILVYNRNDLLSRINSVSPFVQTVQIDVMDGIFVPNKTLTLSDLSSLPTGVKYEFHWMVQDPQNWISHIGGPHLHLIAAETISSKTHFEHLKKLIKAQGGSIGLVLEPGTPLAALDNYISDASQVLVMSVNSGFDGQKYIPLVEKKILELRKKYPRLAIEIDGGITLETIIPAAKAGANKFAAASSIFKASDIKTAIQDLLSAAKNASLGDLQ